MSSVVTPASPSPPTFAPSRMSPKVTSRSDCGNGSGLSKTASTNREHSSGGADTDGKHEYGSRRKAGRLQQTANRNLELVGEHYDCLHGAGVLCQSSTWIT